MCLLVAPFAFEQSQVLTCDSSYALYNSWQQIDWDNPHRAWTPD